MIINAMETLQSKYAHLSTYTYNNVDDHISKGWDLIETLLLFLCIHANVLIIKFEWKIEVIQ